MERCLYSIVHKLFPPPRFDTEVQQWQQVIPSGNLPSSRHSHAGVEYNGATYIFAGYDGNYRNDFHEYSFVNKRWDTVHTSGSQPKARYRTSAATYDRMRWNPVGSLSYRCTEDILGIRVLLMIVFSYRLTLRSQCATFRVSTLLWSIFFGSSNLGTTSTSCSPRSPFESIRRRPWVDLREVLVWTGLQHP